MHGTCGVPWKSGDCMIFLKSIDRRVTVQTSKTLGMNVFPASLCNYFFTRWTLACYWDFRENGGLTLWAKLSVMYQVFNSTSIPTPVALLLYFWLIDLASDLLLLRMTRLTLLVSFQLCLVKIAVSFWSCTISWVLGQPLGGMLAILTSSNLKVCSCLSRLSFWV